MVRGTQHVTETETDGEHSGEIDETPLAYKIGGVAVISGLLAAVSWGPEIPYLIPGTLQAIADTTSVDYVLALVILSPLILVTGVYAGHVYWKMLGGLDG